MSRFCWSGAAEQLVLTVWTRIQRRVQIPQDVKEEALLEVATVDLVPLDFLTVSALSSVQYLLVS